jgi:hypothetical protein
MFNCNKDSKNYSEFYRLCDRSRSTAFTSNSKFLSPYAPEYDCNFGKQTFVPIVNTSGPPPNFRPRPPPPISSTPIEKAVNENPDGKNQIPKVDVIYQDSTNYELPPKEHANEIKEKSTDSVKFNKKLWGGPAWEFLHAGTWAYPENPTKEQQTLARIFYESLPYQLPCGVCEGHCANYIRDNPPATKNRESLTRWLWNFHNAVNKRLGKPEHPWEKVVDKFSTDGNGSFCSE